MRKIRLGELLLSTTVLVGCQRNLPSLDNMPHSGGSPFTIVQDEVACELGQILTTEGSGENSDGSFTSIKSKSDTLNQEFKRDPQHTTQIIKLLKHLTDDHFVATINIATDTTNTEGLDPSAGFTIPFKYKSPYINSPNFLFGLNGELNGTQDRTDNISFFFDLSQLQADYGGKNGSTDYCNDKRTYDQTTRSLLAYLRLSGGISDDLGLADIVGDGLLNLDNVGHANIYGSTGPTAPSLSRYLDLESPSPKDQDNKFLKGTLAFAPSVTAPGTSTASFMGILTAPSKDNTSQFSYIINLTGFSIQPDSDTPTIYPFQLSGTISQMPSDGQNSPFNNSQPIAMTGSIDLSGPLKEIKKQVKVAVTVGSTSSPGGIQSFSVQLPESKDTSGNVTDSAMSTVKSSSSGGSQASPSGTSFGSTINFTTVYGLNGGPIWSLSHFKGPSGGASGSFSQLLNYSHTNADTLTINFVPACRNPEDVTATINDYWDTIGPCTAQSTPAAVAFGFNQYLFRGN